MRQYRSSHSKGGHTDARRAEQLQAEDPRRPAKEWNQCVPRARVRRRPRGNCPQQQDQGRHSICCCGQ
ncbi:hypothetical protein MRX96_026530 [Rhipicephalus microplus]